MSCGTRIQLEHIEYIYCTFLIATCCSTGLSLWIVFFAAANLCVPQASCRRLLKKSKGSPRLSPGARRMTTLLPPPSKRAKLANLTLEPLDLSTVTGNVLCQFGASDTGETTGSTIRIPAKTTAKELELLLNQLLNNVCPHCLGNMLNMCLGRRSNSILLFSCF